MLLTRPGLGLGPGTDWAAARRVAPGWPGGGLGAVEGWAGATPDVDVLPVDEERSMRPLLMFLCTEVLPGELPPAPLLPPNVREKAARRDPASVGAGPGAGLPPAVVATVWVVESLLLLLQRLALVAGRGLAVKSFICWSWMGAEATVDLDQADSHPGPLVGDGAAGLDVRAVGRRRPSCANGDRNFE